MATVLSAEQGLWNMLADQDRKKSGVVIPPDEARPTCVVDGRASARCPMRSELPEFECEVYGKIGKL